MPVIPVPAWGAEETYGTYLPADSSVRRSKFAFWEAISIATRSFTFRDDLTYERPLGKGSQFIVDLYRYQPVNWPREANIPDLIAVKTARILNLAAPTSAFDRHDLFRFIREIQILNHGPVKEHPNIVRLLSSTWKEGHTETPVPQLLVEYAPLGNLYEYLRQGVPVTIAKKLKVIRDTSNALVFLHGAGIVHGDVKTPNVMIFRNEDGEGITAKLSDFGCAITDMDEEETKVYRGTRSYFPPDMKEGHVSSMEALMKCEVFVFALCIWEVMQDGKPYYAASRRIQVGEQDTWFLLEAFDGVIRSLDLESQPKSEELIVDDLTMMKLQGAIHSMLEPKWHSRPAMHEVSDTLGHFFKSAPPNDQSTKETTAPLTAIPGFAWAEPCVWSYTDSQQDIPYTMQRQWVQALEALLPTLPKDDLGFAFLLLSYSAAHGYGKPIDLMRSVDYLRKSAEAGSGPAQFLLPRLLPALLESRRPEVDHSALAAFNSSIESPPQALHLESLIKFLPQHEKFNTWWRGLMELGQQQELSLELTLLAPTGTYQVPSPREPKAVFQFMEDQCIDPANCLVQLRERHGRPTPPLDALHFFAGHGCLDPFKSLRRRGCQIPTNAARIEWYGGTVQTNTNLALSAAVNGRYEMTLYLLENANGPIQPPLPVDNPAELQDLVNGLHLLGMFDSGQIPAIASAFVQRGADPNMHRDTFTYWVPRSLPGFPLPLGGGTPLDVAVWLRSKTAVSTLLSLGADPTLKSNFKLPDYLRRSPLQLAVSLHHYEIVELMLTHIARRKNDHEKGHYAEDLLLWIAGELVGAKDLWRQWVMHGSEWQNALKRTLELCLQHGADRSYMRSDGAKPLPLACMKHPCQSYIVEALLEAGCDPNERAGNNQGALPIHTCIMEYWSDTETRNVLELLVKYKADLDVCMLGPNAGSSCIRGVVSENWTETLAFLSDAGANLNIRDGEGRTPLFEAIRFRATDSVRLLLELGVEIDATDSRGETALHLAIEEGETECVELLFDYGANVERTTSRYGSQGLDKINALELAAYWGRIPVLDVVVKHFRDKTYEPGGGYSVLDAAVHGSELDALKFLLRREPDICKDLLLRFNAKGNSLLHSSVLHANEAVRHEMIRELLRAGIPIDIRSKMGSPAYTRTALAASAQTGDIETTLMLLKLGASPYCRACPEDKMWTFLHEAAVQSRRPDTPIKDKIGDLIKACQPWIEQHNLLSSEDYCGRTPLHLAVYCGQLEVARSLLDLGCSIYDRVGLPRDPGDSMPDMVGLGALELAYEVATIPAKKRDSYLSDMRGVPDDNLRAVLKLLKSFRAPGYHRRPGERLKWLLKKWRRHSREGMKEIMAGILRPATKDGE